MSTRTIEYGVASIRDFRPRYVETPKGKVLEALGVGEGHALPSRRFWTSLCCRFSSWGVSPKLFKLYDHEEVLERIFVRVGEKDSRVRYAVETAPDGKRHLLGLSAPDKALLEYAPTWEMMQRYAVPVGEQSGGENRGNAVSYREGVLVAEHAPPFGDTFMIGDDKFAPRYITETPVDGFGEPLTYLSLMRQVCTNGAIGYAAAFRSRVALGKADTDALVTYGRMLDAFNNEEGYSALRQRWTSACDSWASIRECEKAYLTMARIADQKGLQDSEYKGTVADAAYRRQIARRVGEPVDIREKINRAYLQITGDICDLYQLTSVDTLSEKKQAQLSSRCTVYDLLNFVTEVSTHWTKPGDSGVYARQLLQAFVGELISNEYDLEGTKIARPSYQDWYLGKSDVTPSDNTNIRNVEE